MKLKKQMIQTSLLAFGLSMGVGLTGSPSALAAPTKVTNAEVVSGELSKAQEKYMNIYNEWQRASLNFFTNMGGKLSGDNAVALLLNTEKTEINIGTAKDSIKKAEGFSELDQNIVQTFNVATQKMLDARDEFISVCKNASELKSYITELDLQINKFEKLQNERKSWVFHPKLQPNFFATEMSLKEMKEMKELLKNKL